MKPIEGYDTTRAATGEYETIEPGAYVLTVKTVTEEASSTGKAGVRIYFDIAEGDHRDYYKRQYDADTRAQKKWAGTKWQMTEGSGLSFFKGFITAIEESNPGYRWNWDERTLTDKRIGGIFRREEYRKTDGTTAWTTRILSFCSVDTARKGVEPPKDKPLEDRPAQAGFAPQTGYIPSAYTQSPKFEEIKTDDDLPF